MKFSAANILNGQSSAGGADEIVSGFNSLKNYFENNIPNIINGAVNILIALIIFVVGRKLIRWIRKRIRTSFERRSADAGLVQFTDSFLKFGLYLVLCLVIAANLGIELSSVTVIFASASVGISLALQETLSNFMGGILILLMKPFSVGDYIMEGAGKYEGTVQEIQTFYTKLTTVDNKTIVIPNGTLANGSLINYTACSKRQLDLKVGISYDADLKKAKAVLEKLLEETEGIIHELPVSVFVDELGDSAVILGYRAWVNTKDYWNVRWNVLENIKLSFDKEQIEIPYSQMTLHMDSK